MYEKEENEKEMGMLLTLPIIFANFVVFLIKILVLPQSNYRGSCNIFEVWYLVHRKITEKNQNCVVIDL